MTNRDKFNQISNAELANILNGLIPRLCDRTAGDEVKYKACKFCYYEREDCVDKDCVEGIEKWLNAPCVNKPEKPSADNKAEKLPKKVDEVFMSNRDKLLEIVEGIIKECKEYYPNGYPNGCKKCFYSDTMGLCCFKDRPITWGLEVADKGTQPDNVNHPAHYTSGQIEVIDFIEDKELGFHLGNAVKYISRAGRKNPDKTIEDLRKAVWYINRQIQRLERAENE